MAQFEELDRKGVEALVYAIINDAVEDYRSALVSHNKSKIDELERWFMSKQFEKYTAPYNHITGQGVIDGVRAELESFNWDLSALKRSRYQRSTKYEEDDYCE